MTAPRRVSRLIADGIRIGDKRHEDSLDIHTANRQASRLPLSMASKQETAQPKDEQQQQGSTGNLRDPARIENALAHACPGRRATGGAVGAAKVFRRARRVASATLEGM